MDFLWLLKGIRTPLLDGLMQLVTYFGQEILILPVVCILFWSIDKDFAYQIGFLYFTSGICVQTLKITFRIPRPWVLDPTFTAVKSAVSGAGGYSFPSGHTQGAVSLFMPFALRSQRKTAKLFCIFAFLLVGFSRMYLGCHTPKDVLASLLLSLLFSFLILRFWKAFWETERSRVLAASLSVFASLSALLACFLCFYGLVPAKYAAGVCKTAGAGLGLSLGFLLEKRYVRFSVKTKSVKAQIGKAAAGLLSTLALKQGLSLAAGGFILSQMPVYFLLMLWILVLYPCLFKYLLRKNDELQKEDRKENS